MPFTESQQALLGPQALALANTVNEANMGVGSVDIPYAATITPAPSQQFTLIVVGTLTGNITVANPTGARKGMEMVLTFTQDGTGSRTITWGAAFSFTANGAGTANQKGATNFVYDGSRWVQTAGALAFKA